MKSNIEWKIWGERDPLFAVATWQGKEKGSPEAWTDSDFYEIGRQDWSDFLLQWQHYGLEPGSCVEIGCGAGRISQQLGRHFEHATCVDVSPHQLEYARQRIPAGNIDFTLTNGTQLPVENASCDAAFSVHVFQHFDSHADALAVFKEIHRALKPGGTLMIHLPLYELPDAKISKLFRPIISLSRLLNDCRAKLARHHLRNGRWRFLMKRLRFDRQQLLADLSRLGFSKIQFRMFPVGSNGSYHEFVLATRAPG